MIFPRENGSHRGKRLCKKLSTNRGSKKGTGPVVLNSPAQDKARTNEVGQGSQRHNRQKANQKKELGQLFLTPLTGLEDSTAPYGTFFDQAGHLYAAWALRAKNFSDATRP